MTGWRAGTEAKGKVVTQEKRNALIAEYERIIRRLTGLAKRCSRSATYIINNASVQEARNSKAQAERLEHLTTLAFIFVPVTFVCTFFGMNFGEFDQGHLSI